MKAWSSASPEDKVWGRENKEITNQPLEEFKSNERLGKGVVTSFLTFDTNFPIEDKYKVRQQIKVEESEQNNE